MLDALIWIALTLSIGTGVLAVWVFGTLASGYMIGCDNLNPIELGLAITILATVLGAWCGFVVRKLKR